MPPQHDEIIRKLDDGWAIAWDTTVVDVDRRAAMDRVIKARVKLLREALGLAVEDAGPAHAQPVATQPGRSGSVRSSRRRTAA